MITPLKTAYYLHKLWPEADYIIVPDGGHSEHDPAIRDRLIAATDNARSIR
jgi:proline iminopeptidase